ncbi:MAG: hypothetical protein HFF11_08335 [Angelakisella sp.]|jgi:uncharacterized membrane protein YkoI|nr:hypothetical protein [Angelakisella sp.]
MNLTGKTIGALVAGGFAFVLLGAGLATVLQSRPEAPVLPSSALPPASPPAVTAPPSAPAAPPASSVPPAPEATPGQPASPAAHAAGDIGEAGAKAAALSQAGLQESQIAALDIDRDLENGRLEYEVEFWAGQVEYDYEIDGATGAILQEQWENHAPLAAASGDIGEAGAKAAALAHAGLSESQIAGLDIDRDLENGRVEYEVDFWAGQVKYDYEIDGATGAILKFERDPV